MWHRLKKQLQRDSIPRACSQRITQCFLVRSDVSLALSRVGGLGLALIGGCVTALRSGSKIAMTLARRHFLMTLEVTNRDRSYPWVLQWVVSQSSKPGVSSAKSLK